MKEIPADIFIPVSFFAGLFIVHLIYAVVIVPLQYWIASKMNWDYDPHKNRFSSKKKTSELYRPDSLSKETLK